MIAGRHLEAQVVPGQRIRARLRVVDATGTGRDVGEMQGELDDYIDGVRTRRWLDMWGWIGAVARDRTMRAGSSAR